MSNFRCRTYSIDNGEGLTLFLRNYLQLSKSNAIKSFKYSIFKEGLIKCVAFLA